MATLQLPSAETDKIGDLLQKEYADKDPNTHIRYFYIRFGKETAQSVDYQQRAIAILKEKLGLKCFKTKPGWEGIVFFEAPVNGSNEREHEEFLNETIRKQLRTVGGVAPHIMFSRACLYKHSIYSHKIETSDIGAILDYSFRQNKPGNAHIEYFYLFAQATIGPESFVEQNICGKNVNIHTEALTVLKELPGDWKSVEPEATWQGTFFGFYPKAMTERARERLLNSKVRLPLINTLEERLLTVTERGGLKIKVQVIITRACKYTPPPMVIPP